MLYRVFRCVFFVCFFHETLYRNLPLAQKGSLVIFPLLVQVLILDSMKLMVSGRPLLAVSILTGKKKLAFKIQLKFIILLDQLFKTIKHVLNIEGLLNVPPRKELIINIQLLRVYQFQTFQFQGQHTQKACTSETAFLLQKSDIKCKSRKTAETQNHFLLRP